MFGFLLLVLRLRLRCRDGACVFQQTSYYQTAYFVERSVPSPVVEYVTHELADQGVVLFLPEGT